MLKSSLLTSQDRERQCPPLEGEVALAKTSPPPSIVVCLLLSFPEVAKAGGYHLPRASDPLGCVVLQKVYSTHEFTHTAPRQFGGRLQTQSPGKEGGSYVTG